MAAILSLFGIRSKPSARELRQQLPAIHSFIDCSARGGPKGQVCFEAIGPKTVTTSTLPGMQAGQAVVLSYTNASGKYSFESCIASVSAKQATLAMPNRIKVLQQFAGARQRNNVRIDTTVNVTWRFTPAGRIATDYQKGSLSDLSRGGAQLTLDRELKVGQKVDVQAPFAAAGPPVLLQGEVRRVDKTRTGKYNAGLRFVDLKPEADQAISEFINRRQADLRSRGLA
jgi:c-di-GMP-binding flagellar brake protein YcgR